MPKKKLNRILIKLSGESLMGKNKFGIDLNTVKRISNDLLTLKKLKIQICVVIGGGNIFRGLAASAKGMDRANADYMGMLATVMNSLALQNSLEKLNVETRVMSAFPIQSICETYIRKEQLDIWRKIGLSYAQLGLEIHISLRTPHRLSEPQNLNAKLYIKLLK